MRSRMHSSRPCMEAPSSLPGFEPVAPANAPFPCRQRTLHGGRDSQVSFRNSCPVAGGSDEHAHNLQFLAVSRWLQVVHIDPPPGLLDIGRRRMLLDYLRPILTVGACKAARACCSLSNCTPSGSRRREPGAVGAATALSWMVCLKIASSNRLRGMQSHTVKDSFRFCEGSTSSSLRTAVMQHAICFSVFRR